MTARAALYGLLAEFDSPDDLVTATRRAREAGYRKMDAYTPFPIPELTEALQFRCTRLRWLALGGALVGGAAGYLVQYWTQVIAYPYNAGGRPLHSWPAFIPVTFEMMMLVAALAIVIGLLVLNGLPMPYHPVFNVPEFTRAMEDRFFLCIEARDGRFQRETTRRFLESLGARGVRDVPA